MSVMVSNQRLKATMPSDKAAQTDTATTHARDRIARVEQAGDVKKTTAQMSPNSMGAIDAVLLFLAMISVCKYV